MKYGFANEREREFPPMVVMGILNVCNLKCIHCYSRKYMESPDFKPSYMKWDLYKKIVDEIANYPGTVLRFTCDGEPTIHPDFFDMLAYAKKLGVSPITFNTNGLALNRDSIRLLVVLGIEAIEFSLDAFHKETYKRVRAGSDFDRVMKNVDHLLELRKKLGGKTKLLVSIIDQPEVKDEIEDFKRYWVKKADKVIVRPFVSQKGLVDKHKESLKPKDRWPCQQFWRRINLTPEGYAEYCVDDWLDQTKIGDVNNQSLKEIWQSEAYQKFREIHLKGEYHKMKQCKDCVEWMVAPWDHDFFSAMKEIGVIKK
ncbi:radical SAM protein [Candidatus Woesearchaeota archaeon]|nr:radical SAM protein [Candidatus Woesearchaeota archaeon]